MPGSSTNAVYDGSADGTNTSRATDGTSHSDAIGRFLADQEQRRPLEFSTTVPSAAEAEAASRARMLAKLHAFEEQFNSDREPRAN